MINPISENWCIKATNDEEAELIAKYATEQCQLKGLSGWSLSDAKQYYLTIIDGKYEDGFQSVKNYVDEILFDEFKKYILNIKDEIEEIETNEIQDYSYLVPILKQLET